MISRYIVVVPPRTADRRIAPLAVAQYSSHTMYIKVIDPEIDGLNVRIFRTPDPQTGEPRAPYVAVATRQEDGLWRCYLTPLCFSDIADNLRYDVIGFDSRNYARHLGYGRLTVQVSYLTADGELPDIIPQDTYIFNPQTQLWHKLTAAIDEAGVITCDVEQEGIVR